MLSRKTIGIIVSVLLIAVMLLVFTDPWSTLRNEARQIMLQHPPGIDRITLAGSYDSTLLVKKENTWYISGEEEANQVTVENLLFAAGRMQIKSIPAGTDAGKVTPVTLVHYFHGEKPVLAYEVSSGGGQFLVRPEGSQKQFSVFLPGFAELDLDMVFSSAPNHYRKHLLIDLRPSDIRYIEVTRKGERPFRFAMDETGEIHGTLLEPDSILQASGLDDLAIRLLFSYFTSIRYESKAGEGGEFLAGRDAIAYPADRWLGRLKVESRQGEKHLLEVYSMPGEAGEINHMFKAVIRHNEETDALVINYIYLDVLMRSLSHYFAADP